MLRGRGPEGGADRSCLCSVGHKEVRDADMGVAGHRTVMGWGGLPKIALVYQDLWLSGPLPSLVVSHRLSGLC